MKKKFLFLIFCIIITCTACNCSKDSSKNGSLEATTYTEYKTTIEAETTTEPETTTELETTTEQETTTEPETKPQSKAEQLLSEMTLEEKVGQLFIIRPENFDASYNVGGLCFFGSNISSPSQITSYIDSLQQQSNIPLFISVDEEGGAVARLANNDNFNLTKYESMESIGNTGNPENAKNVGITIGTYLKKYGFNVDFAPVADVNTNPNNIVIGNRSFGSDPNLVASMVTSAIEGFDSVNVISCMKHFPGHGDTTGDTHKGYVSVLKNWDELKSCELIPFIAGIKNGANLIMIAHITTPNITSDGLPASMSYEMVQEKLRNDLGYNGVVITDAMEMGAIAQNYTSAESAITAINAGVDIILMPQNFVSAYKGIINAVNDGTISESRINESVLRILTLKENYALLN